MKGLNEMLEKVYKMARKRMKNALMNDALQNFCWGTKHDETLLNNQVDRRSAVE